MLGRCGDRVGLPRVHRALRAAPGTRARGADARPTRRRSSSGSGSCTTTASSPTSTRACRASCCRRIGPGRPPRRSFANTTRRSTQSRMRYFHLCARGADGAERRRRTDPRHAQTPDDSFWRRPRWSLAACNSGSSTTPTPSPTPGSLDAEPVDHSARRLTSRSRLAASRMSRSMSRRRDPASPRPGTPFATITTTNHEAAYATFTTSSRARRTAGSHDRHAQRRRRRRAPAGDVLADARSISEPSTAFEYRRGRDG